MEHSVVARFQRWLSYEWDCHERVLASLRALSPDQQSHPAYAQALTLMAHQAEARQLWIARLGESDRTPASLFPEGLTVEEVERLLMSAHELWSRYLDKLSDHDLSQTFRYRSSDGRQTFENSVEDVLTQLFGHAWYHRGQVAALVRSLGGQPAATDYVFRTRRAVPGP